MKRKPKDGRRREVKARLSPNVKGISGIKKAMGQGGLKGLMDETYLVITLPNGTGP